MYSGNWENATEIGSRQREKKDEINRGSIIWGFAIQCKKGGFYFNSRGSGRY